MTRVTQKQIFSILKVALALASLIFFYRVWQNAEFSSSSVKSVQKVISSWPLISILILMLMLLNWFIESVKFRLLLKISYDISPFKAFLAVLAGTTVSNFTPARTGDFIGRMALLSSARPIRVILATITANMSQLLMTYLLGLVFALIYILSGANYTFFEEHLWRLAALIIGLTIAIVLVIWTRRNHHRIVDKLPAFTNKLIRVIRSYPKRILQRVVALALLRYLTFSLQFYLLLQLFSDFKLVLFDFIKVPVAYLMQSLFPVPAVADVGIRVWVTDLLFEHSIAIEQVALAVSALWFINLIVPAILGGLSLIYSLFAKL